MARSLESIVNAFEAERETGDDGYDVRVRLTFIADVLGTATSQEDVYRAYIASKAPDALSKEEEVEALGVDEVADKGMTVFPKDENGNPFMWDYQVRGFFKAACSSLQRCKGMASAKHTEKLKAFRKILDQCILVAPRKIKFKLSGEMGVIERPLRAETAQGPRVALASSETVPSGSTVEFTVRCLNEEWVMALLEWLNYGQYNGMLQWRNSGCGAFLYEILNEEGEVIGGNLKTSTWKKLWTA